MGKEILVRDEINEETIKERSKVLNSLSIEKDQTLEKPYNKLCEDVSVKYKNDFYQNKKSRNEDFLCFYSTVEGKFKC